VNREDYPPQEPLSEMSLGYQATAMRLSEGIESEEHAYAHDHVCQGTMVFRAKKPNGVTLMYMHGGGWTNGYKELLGFMAPPLNDAGFNFVSVGYRLAPQFTFPVGWLDAAKATRWVYDNCRSFGGDPTRIFVGGHSAGAHYAALLAVRRDWQSKLELPTNVVRGCLPISGIYDFTEGSGLSMRPRFLGSVEQKNEFTASPLLYLETKPPPMMLSHGSNDFPHLIKQAKEMEKRLKAIGACVERIELPGKDHLSASHCAAESDGPWVPHAVRFMSAVASSPAKSALHDANVRNEGVRLSQG
jgi:acetyl esterase/lipase